MRILRFRGMVSLLSILAILLIVTSSVLTGAITVEGQAPTVTVTVTITPTPPPPVTVTVTVTPPPITVTAAPSVLSSPSMASPTTATTGYSRSNPAGLNYPLTIKVNSTGSTGLQEDNNYEVQVTLLEFIRGDAAWQKIYAKNEFNDSAPAGFEYLLARLRFEYLSGPSPDSAFEVSSVWFYAVSGNGKDYDHIFITEPDPSLESNLYPEASNEGWIAFLAAQDDSQPLMTFGRKYDGTGGIWFKLY